MNKMVAVTTAGKWIYTAAVQNIYSVPPFPPEDHHEAIGNLNNIIQGMQTHSYELEGLAQANEVLTSSNSAGMGQLAHITVTMNDLKAHIKTLALATTNPTMSKRKFYCWICRRNFTHKSKICLAQKKFHKEDVYKKKLLD